MGIRNSSEIISRKKSYYHVSKSKLKSAVDPLKNLLQKKLQEGRKGVIRAIRHNDSAYDIVLFDEMSTRRIANFCCNSKPDFLSPLSFGFF